MHQNKYETEDECENCYNFLVEHEINPKEEDVEKKYRRKKAQLHPDNPRNRGKNIEELNNTFSHLSNCFEMVVEEKCDEPMQARAGRRRTTKRTKRRSPKPCKPHQVRDPVTYRCKNIRDPSKAPKASARTSRPRPNSPRASARALILRSSSPRASARTSRLRSSSPKASARTSRPRPNSPKADAGRPRRRPLKPCKPHQRRDPVTNRCKNIRVPPSSPRASSSPRVRKPCRSDQILNPETGRCVLKSGKIGKKIMRERRSRSP